MIQQPTFRILDKTNHAGFRATAPMKPVGWTELLCAWLKLWRFQTSSILLDSCKSEFQHHG